MSGMLPELQKFPCSFAAVSDTAIMASMTKTSDRLGIYAANMKDGIWYKKEYDVGLLYKVRCKLGENVSWRSFFETVRESFDQDRLELNTIKSSDGHTSPLLPSAQGDEQLQVICRCSANNTLTRRNVVFLLQKTMDDVGELILTSLLNRHYIYAYPKENEQRLANIITEESAVRLQTEALERESVFLKENVARNRHQETTSTKRIVELKKELNSLKSKEDNENNPWEKLNAQRHETDDQGLVQSRQPNPLGDRTCKEYDNSLLRLIKSRWNKPEDEISVRHNFIIRPYNQSDLVKQTQSFSSRQREIVWKALNKIDEWDYNVFELQSAMTGDDFASLSKQRGGGSLFITMYALLVRYNFLQKFGIDEQIALNWISAVEAGYHANPYHNSMHAADVLQITHFILSRGGLAKRCKLSDEQVFAALFAAAIHDFDHPGINNNFHIKTGSHLATLYNDRSVLENLHVSSVFELMKNPCFNILASFTDDQRREIRETIIEMVLATDMGLHGKYLARFKTRLQEHASFCDKEDQLLALSMTLKMADISNCGRPLEIYLKWSGKVSDEFYLQGDRERNVGLPCSPFMDRMQPAIAKGQIAFMNYIIIPFFDQLSELLPDLRFSVEHAEVNKAYWAMNDDSIQQ